VSAQERDHSGTNAASYDEAHALNKRNDIESVSLITKDPEKGYQSRAGRLVWRALLGIAVALVSGAGGWGLATDRAELKSRILHLEKMQSQEIAARQDRKKAIATLENKNLDLKLELQSLSRRHQAAINEIDSLQSFLSATKNQVVVDSAGYTAPRDKTMKNGGADTAKPVTEADVSVLPEVNPVTGEHWFVNFGLYPRVDAARAWSLRLREKGHSTVIQDVTTAEGESLYRLQVINLPSRAAAKVLASQLEADYSLEPLWFGQDLNSL